MVAVPLVKTLHGGEVVPIFETDRIRGAMWKASSVPISGGRALTVQQEVEQ
jgi:hypothetical protein